MVGGVTGSSFSLLGSALVRVTERRWLLLVPGEEEAEGVVEDLRAFGVPADATALLPSGVDGALERARVISRLASDGALRVLVTPVRSAVDPVPSPHAVREGRLELVIGATLPLDGVVARLVDAGFVRDATADRPGVFAVRGDLVDLWPHDLDRPLRVEWMDDEIEGLRAFDPMTQLSVEVLDRASPSLLLPDDDPEGGTLAEHLDPSWTVLARDASGLAESMERHLARFEGRDRQQREDAWAAMFRLPEVMTSRMKAPAAEALNIGGQIVATAGSAFEDAIDTLERTSRGKSMTLLCFDTDAERDRFREVLAEQQAPGAEKVRARNVVMHVGRLHEGFHSPFLGVGALGHHELFATAVKRRRPREEEAVVSEAIDSFLDLEEGDYVVHLAQGIARFIGLRREVKGGAEQEFLVLEFKDAVELHVPASKIDLVQKYIGGKGDAPDLSRIGSASWEKRKEAVRQAVTDMAADLLEMQAIRARKTGIRHPRDTPWQQEFEAAFPYQATPDQARAAETIKADMESDRPMDRLICGDVGYGKTEVCMRAAFKCVMGERQVAVLVPTTILAQQHWESFKERMKDYPVVIECLSRFRTKKEQQRALEGLASGAVDIVIGTHRLVQGDVSFKDLGLLVIDEEQRFGVGHKERLRRLRTNVDVLIMSATPIPRTLHQAILGIRDISPLGQAPKGRREVRTEVIPYAEDVVRTAILRELDREGQIFFVHNRVQTIYKIAKRLSKLVPEARILVGHGQMPERALERAMLSFLEKRADILVATTIIESGLDIPSVNTIFVDQADRYGLSDLHQLRGRVGRYHHQAYAYFLVRPDHSVSEIAEKRLRAIEEFSRLGAGFQIAMRDMEIRGAGNILGPEQSGHIASVGYEMYCRLLDGAVKRLRNERVELPQEVEINIDFTAYLDDAWITDKKLRVEMYRKLGRATTEAQFEAVIAEMADRFGPPPPVACEFVLVAKIRALMERLRVARLEMMPGEGVALRSHRLKRLMPHVRASGEQVRILRGEVVLLVHPAPFRGPGELLAFLQEHLWVEPSEGPAVSGS
ncbi:MAG: transcription-repair coupling factor [Planctomycetes bacterium]|nr:transcription-repair coupling factor [Planctomycetota bacterium]